MTKKEEIEKIKDSINFYRCQINWLKIKLEELDCEDGLDDEWDEIRSFNRTNNKYEE